MLVVDCAASVLFDSCRLRRAGFNPAPAAGNPTCVWLSHTPHKVLNSDDVAFVECALLGRVGQAPPGNADGGDGEAGLFVDDSQVALYGCIVSGGQGGTCACNGGTCFGGDGGSGLEVYGQSVVLLDRTSPTRGLGGFANQCAAGCDGQDVRVGAGATVNTVQHPDVRVVSDSVVRRDVVYEMELVAPPGAGAFLLTSADLDRRDFGLSIGILHGAAPTTMVPVGAVLPTGKLKVTVSFPPMPGLDVEQVVMQMFVVGAGQRYLTHPRAVLVLDPAF